MLEQDDVMAKANKQTTSGESPYISPAELSVRWDCARSSVDRIASRERFTRICLGEGRNGMVRYVREEVYAYEASRRVVMQ